MGRTKGGKSGATLARGIISNNDNKTQDWNGTTFEKNYA